MVIKYDSVFSKGEGDLDKFKFNINTGNNQPIKQRPYRVPYAKQEMVDKMVEGMLKNKIISKSTSPWASPIVLVKKKDGSERFWVDFRKLNNITVKDNYPLPLIDETLDKLRGAKFYSSIDLASGYWQMALDDESKKNRIYYKQRVVPIRSHSFRIIKRRCSFSTQHGNYIG